MNIVSTLNEKLLKQSFTDHQNESELLAEYKQIAFMYAKVENSIAVLSDLKSDKSYMYYGGITKQLGLSEKGKTKEIDSIWEEDVFNKIHPDDLIEKHVLELHFFHFLKSLAVEERANFYIVSKMRMKDRFGEYITIQHRMFYVCSCPLGNLWLALCLYNYPFEKSSSEISDGIIINSVTGDIEKPDIEKHNNILSHREKEILRLIEKGEMSKSIADKLSISVNTVNRHRQNILEKLRVKNSIEACRVAKLMNLL